MTREDELVKRMERGDPAAADELIKLYYPDILRYCLWHAPDRSLAEDAAQETFLKAIRYFDRYAHKGKFKPFLYRIAANTCIDMQRKNNRPDIPLEEMAVDPGRLEPAFENIHADMAVRQLVSSLPKQQREIVLLRFSQDLILRILLARFYRDAIMPLHLIKILACLSILILISALPLLYRSVRYRMQEIEAASRFSGVRLLLARLIVIGIGDACLLAGIFITTVLKTILPAGSVAFFLCFPFLLAGGGCLYLLGHYPPKQFFAGSLLLCAFLAVMISVLPGQYLELCQPPLAVTQILLCALLLAFCARQIRYLIRIPSYEEMQLN